MTSAFPQAPRFSALVAVCIAALLPAGCGDDDAETAAESGEATGAGETRTFDDPDYGITFEYPADLKVKDNVSFGATSGSGPEESAGARLGVEDFFAIQRFPLNAEITHENLEQFIPEGDAVFSELAREEVSGEPFEAGGMPALRYEFGPTKENGGATEATMVFDGDTEYLFTCKATEAHSDAIGAACDTAVETVEVR